MSDEIKTLEEIEALLEDAYKQWGAERDMLIRFIEFVEDLDEGHDHRTMASELVREAKRVLRGKVD